MAESESQFWPILYVGAALDRYYQARDDVYVVGNLLLYYQEGDPGKSVSPDLMVVLGAPKHIRSSYRLWEEPKAPDFVLEIASESTHRIDRGEKRDLYAGMGVSEYWQYDPVGDYLEPPLLGFRLVEGRYLPISATAQEGGMLALRSEVLGLELHLTPGRRCGRRCTFMIRCAGSTCAPTGKPKRAWNKLRTAWSIPKDSCGRRRTACGKNSRRARRWRMSFGSCGSAGAEAARAEFPPMFHCVARKRPFQPRLSHRFGPKPAKSLFPVASWPRLPFRPATTRIQNLQKRAYRKLSDGAVSINSKTSR